MEILGTEPRSGPGWMLEKVRVWSRFRFCQPLRVPAPRGWQVHRLMETSWTLLASAPVKRENHRAVLPLQAEGARAASFLMWGGHAHLLCLPWHIRPPFLTCLLGGHLSYFEWYVDKDTKALKGRSRQAIPLSIDLPCQVFMQTYT